MWQHKPQWGSRRSIQALCEKRDKMTARARVISLKFVSSGGEAVGYLMVETDDLKRAEQVARFWAAAHLSIPFKQIEVHQGMMDAPDTIPKRADGVRVWALPF